MPGPASDKKRHFILAGTAETKAFTAHQTPRQSAMIPAVNRASHGAALRAQLNEVKQDAVVAANAQQALDLQSSIGLQVVFESRPEVKLAFESLQNEPNKIELLSLKEIGSQMVANVFVPDGKLAHFEAYITAYLEERRTASGRKQDHHALLETIASIRTAEVRALWTDDIELLPANQDEAFWWEVWLPVRDNRDQVLEDFRKIAAASECRVSAQPVHFPERTVVWMYGSENQLTASRHTLNCVAELRRAKQTAEFFLGLPKAEQHVASSALLSRMQFDSPNRNTPYVCVLDTGVTRAHPLIAPLLAVGDMHTVNPGWGVDDTVNHGTGMVGLAAYGDLSNILSNGDPMQMRHRLESVKLLDRNGGNTDEPGRHAYIFAEAVSRPEVSAPERLRVFATAITATDGRDRGRPSSWSAAIDHLAADVTGLGERPRLFVLAAGDTDDIAAWNNYPASLDKSLIQDPGQAWNALTVGAFTEKTDMSPADVALYDVVAEAGALSPHTTTSSSWISAWPLKPDIVCEGGNVAKDSLGAIGMESLDLLTTNNAPLTELFTNFNATSSASALCAKMAAELMADYPALRSETIRALIVHSAQWTDPMRDQYLGTMSPSHAQCAAMVRNCGWGVPNLDRARWSAGNSLTLIVEGELQPYWRHPDGGYRSKDMDLHTLPWPAEELEALGETPVELWITLSYFVEPNPSARGGASKFHYPSHRLRFDVKRSLDRSTEAFVARLNAAAEAPEDDGFGPPSDPNWLLGARYRHRGSLHQDVWKGTAAELAKRNVIGVYPGPGWWRTRHALRNFNRLARYSLVVSIRTPESDIDLYTPIENQIRVPVAIGV